MRASQRLSRCALESYTGKTGRLTVKETELVESEKLERGSLPRLRLTWCESVESPGAGSAEIKDSDYKRVPVPEKP